MIYEKTGIDLRRPIQKQLKRSGKEHAGLRKRGGIRRKSGKKLFERMVDLYVQLEMDWMKMSNNKLNRKALLESCG